MEGRGGEKGRKRRNAFSGRRGVGWRKGRREEEEEQEEEEGRRRRLTGR